MGGWDGQFSLTATYFAVLLQAVNEASDIDLRSLYSQQAFALPGDAHISSPVSVSGLLQ